MIRETRNYFLSCVLATAGPFFCRPRLQAGDFYEVNIPYSAVSALKMFFAQNRRFVFEVVYYSESDGAYGSEVSIELQAFNYYTEYYFNYLNELRRNTIRVQRPGRGIYRSELAHKKTVQGFTTTTTP